MECFLAMSLSGGIISLRISDLRTGPSTALRMTQGVNLRFKKEHWTPDSGSKIAPIEGRRLDEEVFVALRF